MSHYRSDIPTKDQLAQFKPGDEVDYLVDHLHDRGSSQAWTVTAVVVRVTDKRVVVRVANESRSRSVKPVNLSKRVVR